MSVADRWEVGSDFHWMGLPQEHSASRVPWADGLLLFSGRDALRLVLRDGVTQRGWRRLWVPDYFCQHVVGAMVRPDLQMLPYADNPLRSQPELPPARPGDAIFVMNYFGLRARPELTVPDGVDVIEDHSHDPTSAWAKGSIADFCVASLRKTLPISDGGALWSPVGHRLPPQPPLSEQRLRAGATRMTAMMLKSMYLSGLPVDKGRFRSLMRRGERALARPGIAGMTEVSKGVVGSHPFEVWRQARSGNWRALVQAVGDLERARILQPVGEAVAFTVSVVFDTTQGRKRIRNRLVEADIYPAVHWPLEQTVLPVGAEALDLSRRLLSIPCDGRYDISDMVRVAGAIREASESALPER